MTKLLGATAPSNILDIGAGSGFFSRYLLRHTSARSAWCVDISYEMDSDSEENGKPIHFRRSSGDQDADLVLLMDVLEHVDDDVRLVSDYVVRVPSGSRFLISVPAFRFLWSQHDEFLGHRRRYTLRDVEALVKRAGLRVERSAYYFAYLFPVAAATRLKGNWFRSDKHHPRSQLKKHHWLVNETLAAICLAELPIVKFNRFAGLTIFCLAKGP